MTNRMRLGQQGDGSYGMRVSQAGYDVNSASDDQLAFSSDWFAGFRVAYRGDASVAYAGGTWQAFSYPTLGYIPMAFAFAKDTSNRWISTGRFASFFSRTYSPGQGQPVFGMKISATQIFFSYWWETNDFSLTSPLQVKYIITRERLVP